MAPKNETPEAEAQKLLDECGITTIPVPVDKLAKQLGAQLRFSPLDEELSGMVYVKDGVLIIGVNALDPPNRQRFTIAHEIGHYRLHKRLITESVHVDFSLKRDATAAKGTQRIEVEANQFGAALLIPRKILAPMLASIRNDIDAVLPLEEWAKKFKVSKETLDYRIRNFHQGQTA